MPSKKIINRTGLLPGRKTIGPLFLCLFAPVFIIILYHTIVYSNGSFPAFFKKLQNQGLVRGIYEIWPTWKNIFVWKMIFIYMLIQIFIMKYIPGKMYNGPVTPGGDIPIYKANGFQAFTLSLVLYNLGVFWGLYNGGILYDYLGEILSSMNVFALIFCVILYFKGIYFPTNTDHGTSGNAIFDFYWGTELQPRIFDLHVKQFTNCRCGMMFWALFIISCLYKQYESYEYLAYGTLASAVIQLIYIGKFFLWETGYFDSMDMTHDRAGFYLCWGCLVFLPCVHTCQIMYLAEHPDTAGLVLALVLSVAGLVSIWITYDCDRQKQDFRRCQGRCKIWGKEPNFIQAKYKLQNGETKTSLLLVCGWWGITRYFHYIPEWSANLCWTVAIYDRPWLFAFYVLYLTILVADRGFRDEARCRNKYGKYWQEYCRQVPYMFVPGLY